MVAGWPTRLSTPPSDSASTKIRVRSTNRRARAGVAEVERDHPAESAHLPAGELVLGMGGQPGIVDLGDLGPAGEPFGDPAPVGVVLPHPERQGLDAAQRQPAIHRPGHGAGGVLDEAEPLGQIVPRRDQHAAHHVAVAVEVLGGRVEHDVGAATPAAAGRRAWRRCCRPRTGSPRAWARSPTAARSTRFIIGLVGVSQ